MFLWDNDFQSIFWIAVIPAAFSIALLGFGLKEPKTPVTRKRTNPLRSENLKKLSAAYWWVVVIGSIFTLARFSEAFLVLRAQQMAIPLFAIPLVMVAMNLVYSLTAYPFGKLSDSMSHSKMLQWGLLVLIAALGGILLASRIGSSQVNAGGGYLMDAVAAAWIGFSLAGSGKPNALGTLVGAVILGVLSNGLVMLSVPYYAMDIIKGLVLAGALALTYFQRRT